MTDRIRGFVVTLLKDMREDDAENTLNAIRQIKGVLAVESLTTDAGTIISERRIRAHLMTQIWDVVEKGKAS